MSPRPAPRAVFAAAVTIALSLALGASPALAATKSAPATAPLIVIDPGHGGPFSNANANGLRERVVTLQIGLALRSTLESRGYRVIMTRTTDRALQTTDTETWNLKSDQATWAYARDYTLYYRESIPKDDLTARTRVANIAGADLFISIHCNGAASKAVHGTETWASPHDAAGKTLAKIVQPALVSRSHLLDRGWHTADFYVLRWTNMPAILVESAFISNKSDAAKLKTTLTRSAIASGIADGVDTWFARDPFPRRMARASADSQAMAAAAISRTDFPLGARVVVLARANQATDAPGAAPLATRLGAPLLLSCATVPSSDTLSEIARLAPDEVVLVGLHGAFDKSGVTSALRTSRVSANVTMLDAADRPSLSEKIASRMGTPGTGSVMLANADDDRAIMAAAPMAARTGTPILLTDDTSVGACSAYLATQAVNTRRVVRIGSARTPAPFATSAKVVTFQYKDPAHIAYALNAETYMTKRANSLTPIVVNSSKPGDLLTAAVRGARLGQPVITLADQVMSPYTRLYITNRRSQIKTFSLIESKGSLPSIAETILAKADTL